jgi:hemerythrin superfamily protein
MDSTALKFLQNFGELAKADPKDPTQIKDKLLAMIKLKFEDGVLAWEYLIRTHYNTYSKDKELAKFIGDDLLNVFYGYHINKTINAISDEDVPWITEFVFEYNPLVDTGLVKHLIFEACTSNNNDKLKQAKVWLEHIASNRNIKFGDYLKMLTEHAIAEHIKSLSTKTKNMPFPKKQAALLLEFIDKVKGPQKALLTQRIKEIS